MQRELAYGGLPKGGWAYCGPVAASNSLLWLADHGYPRFAPNTGDRKKDQFLLIKALALPKYINCIKGSNPLITIWGSINEWEGILCYGHSQNSPSRPYLIIHDPARRSGMGISHEKAVLEAISGGTLAGRLEGLPRPATDFYKLGGDMRIHKKADVAILEGAIALELTAP